MKDLFCKTPAYKILSSDKKAGKLSHAYLLVCDDPDLLGEYLTDAAKLIACGEEDYCDKCRICRLIGENKHPDVTFYPKEGAKKPLVADADEIVSESVVRPYEIDKRIFVVKNFDELLQNQNKLLKTLEEPPKNVVILLGTQKESAILSTVKSRVRKLVAPPLSVQMLAEEFGKDYPDKKRFYAAAVLSGGNVGKMRRIYESDEQFSLFNAVMDILSGMDSAKDMPRAVAALAPYAVWDVVVTMKAILFEMLSKKCGAVSLIEDARLDKASESFKEGAIASVIERLGDVERAATFNGNQTVIKDRILFAVMEEKAKWRRL